MIRRQILILAAVMLAIFFAIDALAQEQCPFPTTITLGNAVVQPCSTQRIDIPVYIDNPCPVGGFQLQVITTDPNWLFFNSLDSLSADTIGSRIGNWESFGFTINPNFPSTIRVTGIADMPGGGNSIYLPPGDGLLCTIHLTFTDHLVCDSSQLLNFGTTRVSDTTGYILFDPLYLVRDSVYVTPGNCHGNPRGDANCSGVVNGIDVTFLVAYFHGGRSFCCLCSGDANGNGSVNGIDVTFLIAYLKGGGTPPGPCE